MTASTPSPAAIKQALSELNGFATTDRLAAFLDGEGCRGRRGSTLHCPIAVWLHRRFGLADVDAWMLTVGAQDQVRVYSPTNRRLLYQVLLPPVAVRFMVDFDRSRFPRLIQAG